MAAVPDFGALASAQANENDQATNLTNMANRPNQYNRMGSVTWGRNPDGSWSQSSTLDPWANDIFGRTMSGQQNLSSQIGAGINSDGLMGWGSSDLTGNLGAMPTPGQYNSQVINAWNALQEPGLAKAEAAQRQRLAAQGITGGSAISSISDRNLGNVRTDAGNKAILAGYQQGNTEFDQALKARGQGYTENLGKSTLQNQMRQQQFGERTSAYDAAMKGSNTLTGIRDSLNPNNWAAKVPTSGAYLPETIYGAAQDTFNANRQNENAEIAKSQARTDSAVNALRAAGGVSGVATGIGNLWTGAQNAYSGLFGGGDASLWNQWTGTGSYNYDVNNLGMDSPAYQDNSSFWGGYPQTTSGGI